MGATRGARRVDRDLVEQAQAGDREAYVDLIRGRSDRLFAIAYRVLRDVDRAEDALQDALVIAWRDLRGLRDADRFDAWLHKVLVNTCIAQATRERRRIVEPPGAPGRRTGGARNRLSPSPIATSSHAGFRRLPPDQRRNPRPAPLPGLQPGRDRRHARHPAGHGPLPTSPRPPRHAGRPRGGRSDRRQSEVVRHDART